MRLLVPSVRILGGASLLLPFLLELRPLGGRFRGERLTPRRFDDLLRRQSRRGRLTAPRFDRLFG